MSRNACIIGMGSFFSWLAFTMSMIALFAPFWFTQEGLKMENNKGIVMNCVKGLDGDRECEWTAKNTWEDVKDSDDDSFGENFLTVQVLWILGCAAFLVNAALSFLLCCDSCKGPCCSITLTVLVFIAAACLTISVIIFGADQGDKWSRETTLSVGEYYDWGYYVAIVAAVSACLAILFNGFIICCTRNEV